MVNIMMHSILNMSVNHDEEKVCIVDKIELNNNFLVSLCGHNANP